jgi:hypothetical protein
LTSRIGLIPIPFTDGFYKTRSRPFASQRCINWYPNYPTSGALNEVKLYPCSGLRQLAEAGTGINRGGWKMNNRPYFVNGNELYRIDRIVNTDLTISYEEVLIGSIAGTGRVIMDDLQDELCIVVPGVAAYIYVDGGALTEITDPDFDGPVDDVKALDGVFVFCKTDSNIVFHSAINDGLSYDALDSYPVPQLNVVVGLSVYRNQLYVHGDTTTVPFNNVQGLQFLFAPIPNAVIDTGLRANQLKTEFRQSLVWMGSGENAEVSIWLYSGGSPQNISTEPLDFIIQNMSEEDIDRAFIMRHSQNGAEFIVLTIGDYTFKYDLSASSRAGEPVWHEQRSRIPAGDNYVDSVWRVNSIVQAYNRVMVGDSVDGRIGEISDEVGTEYGVKMARRVNTRPLSNNGVKSKVLAIEVFTDTGVYSDDVMNLSWSDDGGYTFGNKLSRSLGAIGQYGRRVVWNRLGAFSIARELQIEYSGEYPRSINKVMANAQ